MKDPVKTFKTTPTVYLLFYWKQNWADDRNYQTD